MPNLLITQKQSFISTKEQKFKANIDICKQSIRFHGCGALFCALCRVFIPGTPKLFLSIRRSENANFLLQNENLDLNRIQLYHLSKDNAKVPQGASVI